MFTAIISILGRVLLSAIFLLSAVGNKIPKFKEVVDDMTKHGVPSAKYMLGGAIVFLIAGSLSIILGFKARIGALMLIVFLVLATYYYHLPTSTADAKEKQDETIQLMKNTAMFGALLFIMANGAGAGSLDSGAARGRDVVE